MPASKMPTVLGLAIAFLLHSLARPAPMASARTPTQPTLITLEEAEILIYLLPQAHALRAEGWDVGWDLNDGPTLNQVDYYHFYVFNAKRPSYGSVTIGYFEVNKHTADVRGMDEDEFVNSPELLGVQKIIRAAHSIDQTTIQKYRSANPYSFLTEPSANCDRADLLHHDCNKT